MAFAHRIRVRYGEVDAQGVVFNAHWLTYFDETATRLFDALGFPPKQTFTSPEGFDFMVVRAELAWKGPAGFDDVIEVAATVPRLGRSSFDLAYRATVDGREACTATVTYVVITPGSNRPRPLPDELRSALLGVGG